MDASVINSWLKNKNRDHNTGIAILENVKPDSIKLNFIKNSSTNYAKSLLFKEISKLKPTVFTEESSNVQVNDPTYDEKLESLTVKWKNLYKEAAFLHAKLLSADIVERAKYASQILNNMEIVNQIWKNIDHFKQYGELPFDPKTANPIEGKSDADLIKRLTTVRTYISKLNKSISTKDQKSSKKIAKQIDSLGRYQKEIALIEEKLNSNASIQP